MWWVIILLSFIILLVTFLLLTPIIFELDSETGQFELRIAGIAKANLILEDQLWLQFRVLIFKFRIDPFKPGKKKPQEEIKRKKNRKKISFKALATKSSALVQSFHIRKFHCDMDSGNFLLNSWLYHVFHFIDPSHRHWNINFIGRTNIALTIENNLLRLIRAMLS